jgi:hypothetical protein
MAVFSASKPITGHFEAHLGILITASDEVPYVALRITDRFAEPRPKRGFQNHTFVRLDGSQQTAIMVDNR